MTIARHLFAVIMVLVVASCAVVRTPDREQIYRSIGLKPVYLTEQRFTEASRNGDPIFIVGGNGGWFRRVATSIGQPPIEFLAMGYAKFGAFTFDAFTVPPGEYEIHAVPVGVYEKSAMMSTGVALVRVPIEVCALFALVGAKSRQPESPKVSLARGDVVYLGHFDSNPRGAGPDGNAGYLSIRDECGGHGRLDSHRGGIS